MSDLTNKKKYILWEYLIIFRFLIFLSNNQNILSDKGKSNTECNGLGSNSPVQQKYKHTWECAWWVISVNSGPEDKLELVEFRTWHKDQGRCKRCFVDKNGLSVVCCMAVSLRDMNTFNFQMSIGLLWMSEKCLYIALMLFLIDFFFKRSNPTIGLSQQKSVSLQQKNSAYTKWESES